jgi:hypothetical protein
MPLMRFQPDAMIAKSRQVMRTDCSYCESGTSG